MMKDHVCKWIENLRPRVTQYLYYQDILEETRARMDGLQGRPKTEYQIQILSDFLTSEFYNADFDPWPDLETRVDTIDDLLGLIENDIDRKKFENSAACIFREDEAGSKKEEPEEDTRRKEFFSMMTEAFGTQELFDSIERSKTEVTEILGSSLITGEENPSAEEQEDLYDHEGAEALKARLADILDGHVDSF